MKKKGLTLILSLVLAFSAALGVSAALADVDSALTVKTVAHNDIAGGYGKGISIEFNETLDSAAIDNWKPLDASKIKLVDKYGAAIAVNAESVGEQICVNRGAARTSKAGDILTFESGFIVKRTDNEAVGSGTLAQTVSFVAAKDYAPGDVWAEFVPATGITLNSETLTLEVGGNTKTLTATVAPETSNAILSFKSADETIASVTDAGVVTGLAEGTTTITVRAGTLTKTVAVTVEAAKAPQSGIKITTKDKTITTFLGYDWDLKKLTVVKMFGENEGSAVTIAKEMVTGTFDKTKIGDYAMTLTETVGEETFTDTFTVKVVEIPEIKITSDFGKGAWGDFYVVFDQTDIAQFLNLKDKALADVKAHVTYNGADKVTGVKNLGGTRYELYFAEGTTPKAGDKLVMKKGMGIWRYSGTTDGGHDNKGDGEFFLIGELKADRNFVYTGSKWAEYTAEPKTLKIDNTETFVSVGGGIQLKWTIGPEGTYGTPVFTSSDTAKATVDAAGMITGKAEGVVTITAKLSDKVTATYKITVTPAKKIKGVELVDIFNVYTVLKDSDTSKFKPEFKSARLVFEDDTYSPNFVLTAADYKVTTIDTSKTGDFRVKVTVTYKETDYECFVDLNVYEYYPQEITTVGIVDWFSYAIFLQFQDTSTNLGNITDSKMVDGILDHVKYERADGTVIPMSGFYVLGTNVALFPNFGKDVKLTEENYDQYYLEGDILTVSEGFKVWKWTGSIYNSGSDDHALKLGTGECIVEGTVGQTLQYRYQNKVWNNYVEYTDMTVANDTIAMKIGEDKLTGAARVPDNATTGVFTYTPADPTIVSISAQGVMTGLKAGTTKVTIELAGGKAGSKSVEITVTVEDYVTDKLKIEPGELTIEQNGALDLTKFTAKYLYASGKTGEAVDLSKAKVTGLDVSKLGQQTVVISVTIDGKTYSSSVKVTVQAPTNDDGGSGGGCSRDKSAAAVLGLLAAGAVLLKKR